MFDKLMEIGAWVQAMQHDAYNQFRMRLYFVSYD